MTSLGRIVFGPKTVDEQKADVARVLSAQRAMALPQVDDRTRRHLVSAVRERLEVVAVLSGGTIELVLLQEQAEQIVAAVLAELRGLR